MCVCVWGGRGEVGRGGRRGKEREGEGRREVERDRGGGKRKEEMKRVRTFTSHNIDSLHVSGRMLVLDGN